MSDIQTALETINAARPYTEPIDNHSDIGYTNRFCLENESTLQFVPERGTWLVNNGLGIWNEKPGGDNAAVGIAMDFAQGLADDFKSQGKALMESGNTDSKKAGEELVKKSSRIQQRNAVTNIVQLAKSITPMQTPVSKLDTEPFLIGTDSGVLDIRTRQIVSGPIDSLITRQVPVRWNPDAKCPQFEAYLQQVFKDDDDIIALMAKWLGYSLTGSTKEQKFVILYGPRGRNGKSVLLDVMRDVMGQDYFAAIDKRLLTISRAETRFALSNLEGKRAVFASETNEQARLDVEFIKSFTAGDVQVAERKGVQPYDFAPQAKLIFALNTLPYAKFDNSFRNRVIPVPMLQSFYKESDIEFQEGDLPPDKELPDKLHAEREGIFAFWVKAHDLYLNEGLTVPMGCRQLVSEFEEQNDYVSMWITECCDIGNDYREKFTNLYASYRGFCERQRLPQPTRPNEFVQRLRDEPGLAHVKPGNVSTFNGIRLMVSDSVLGWAQSRDQGAA